MIKNYIEENIEFLSFNIIGNYHLSSLFWRLKFQKYEGQCLLIFLRLIGGIGGGIIFSSCMSSIVRGFQENYQASAMGIFQAVYAIGMFLGPILSGVIGSSINLESVFIFSSSVTLPIILISFFIKKEELAK